MDHETASSNVDAVSDCHSERGDEPEGDTFDLLVRCIV